MTVLFLLLFLLPAVAALRPAAEGSVGAAGGHGGVVEHGRVARFVGLAVLRALARVGRVQAAGAVGGLAGGALARVAGHLPRPALLPGVQQAARGPRARGPTVLEGPVSDAALPPQAVRPATRMAAVGEAVGEVAMVLVLSMRRKDKDSTG